MKESKADRFRRVAEARVNKIIKMVRLLGNCSGDVYEYTPEQVNQIFVTLYTELNFARKRYKKPANMKFTLSDKEDNNLSEYSEIELPLPDGNYLKAVSITDENFPAINIYLNCGVENPEGIICFVEYNPEQKPGCEICIGAYRSDKDDTNYYEPYMAEREFNEEI